MSAKLLCKLGHAAMGEAQVFAHVWEVPDGDKSITGSPR
ncbi:hypothetical protein H310_08421 [Aphanomyces invadans]|uniref:Uncharacterized protein n=1 Tax=Aphanomyces invadans TaxID=157072 RepID=A0A024TY91_9STRA|nr:hypothetical protein H310_08421 [Aphanomyces invadans]ETV98934.1 hypothetical protein H310_08421 [Aphanomyces invadans]|eukprot:XP_008872362.1 hypothetical protein H310_08421 [Aphanomyces invadans]